MIKKQTFKFEREKNLKNGKYSKMKFFFLLIILAALFLLAMTENKHFQVNSNQFQSKKIYKKRAKKAFLFLN